MVTSRACFAVVLLALLVLAGCTGKNQNAALNPYAKYYTGTQGVEATFQNVPTKLYYYGPGDNSGNEFSFAVETRNEGASFTRGGVYVSGFDPNMLQFRQIPIRGSTGACGISIGQIGLGELGGIFHCDGVDATFGDQNSIRIESVAALLSTFGKDWMDPDQFDLSIDARDDPNGWNVVFNFPTGVANLEYYQHGRLFIAMFLSAVNFEKNGGQEFRLAGDTYDFPGGESQYFVYDGRIASWPPGLDQTDQKLLLTTCYQYTTYADPVVCIDPEPFSDNRKVCVPKSRTWSGGNGAPVAVTSIEQENTPKKIIFRINVKNVGGGTVYDPGELERCSPYYPGRVTAEDLNIVYLGDVRIGQVGLSGRGGTGGMTCYPEVIRLDPRTGTGTTTCTYPIEFGQLRSAYQTPLTVELWYGYSKTQERTLTIKRVI